jgi:CBS domain-containing protein
MVDDQLLRLIHVRPEFPRATPIREVVGAMSQSEVGAVAVIEGRKVVGIFTERDLMTRVVIQRRDPGETTIGDVMTSPALTVDRDATVEQAASVMRSKHVRHLVVVDEDGDLLGIVSLRQVLYHILDRLEGKLEDQERFIMTDGPGG